MKSFLKGFFSIFSWMDCYNDLSPKERVDQILDEYYDNYPWIERNDSKALEKDREQIIKDYADVAQRRCN